MDQLYKIKPFGTKFKNTLWRIAATAVIVVCMNKFELNPSGLSIAAGLALLLFVA